ncbi:hypothetical protein FE257_003868 [Aspergillus nanangensis]|uniref:Life-span regulatory factor-domain-containing protein n=1 Tax=Aspergillus nanangensis TaxID=2582783 RepID=A0AAD4GNC1_ASPNN|nr:hypothetical protein FE257_003868 [Aspergillus nanangensis]
MTQNTFSHHRRSASGPTIPKVRPARPALYRKGTSFVNHPISKLGAGHVRLVHPDDDCQPEMAASFLNFCAMCERQITVPDNALLYCSESCRPPIQSTPVIRIPSETGESKTDQDPSEWKPVIQMTPGEASAMASSDAWKYLSQFHDGQVPLPVRRSRSNHHSSASLSTLVSTTGPSPSLSHTPSSVASSFSSTSSESVGPMHDSAHRPLPPRHNPNFSSSANGTKGLELVMPHMKVHAEEGSPLDTTRGSIFPANSSLWDDSINEKTPTTSTAGVLSAKKRLF